MTIRELFVYLGFDVDTSGAEKMEKSVENVKKRQESMVSSFIKGQMIYDAGKKVISEAFNFVKDSVVGATAEVERYRVALGTMIGDQEKANEIIHNLDYSKTGISDLYGTTNVVGGLQNLVTFGMEAEKASDDLIRLGDIAQGNSEAFVSMSQNLGQIFATGKATSMDLKQFASRGFDVVGELAKIEGKSREEIEKAGIGYEEVKKALDSLTNAGGKYHGMMSKQMDTLGGVIKQFESFKMAVAESIGFAINEPLKDLLKTILEIGRNGQEAFVNKFVGALKVVLHWIHQVVISFEIIKMRIEESGDKFNGLAKLIKSVFSVVGKIIEGLIPILTDIILLVLSVASTIGNFLAPIIQSVGKIIEKILPIIRNIISVVSKIIESIFPILTDDLSIVGKIIEGIIPFIEGIGKIIEWLTPILIFVISIVMKIINVLRNIFAPVVRMVESIIMDVISQFDNWILAVENAIQFFQNAVNVIKSIWEGIKNFFNSLWEGLSAIFLTAISNISNNIINKFNALKNFLVDIWNALKGGPQAFVDFIAGIFHAVVDTIKSIFEAVKNFFVSFWEALKAGPQALADFITGIFTNMFDGIRQKLFGFIDSVKEGWAKVKGIVGGAWDSAVNFVTGGKDKGKGSSKDKALTKSVETAVGNTSTYYGAQSSSNTINAPTTMNITVPQGTSAEQSQAIAEQVKYAYNNQLAYAINSSRSNIPSPERRRY